jgi:hypothetical protein
MSQSDYIKYKRVGTQLRIDSSYNKLPPVLAPQQYIDFKQYALENSIKSTNLVYSNLTPSGEYYNVFGMNKATTKCPSFLVCNNTQNRPNRQAMSTVYYTPTPQPLTIKDMKNAANLKTGCNCTDLTQVCNCAMGRWATMNR